MSKKDQILKLDRTGICRAAIAERVGTSRDYVRVVLDQRGKLGRSIYDERYVAKPEALAKRAACARWRRLKAKGLPIQESP